MPTFKTHAGKFLRASQGDADEIDAAVEKVSKAINKEIDDIVIDKDSYTTHLNKDICCTYQSSTLAHLLSKISSKLDPYSSLTSLMIGNMLTSARRVFATPLQVSLAVLLRDSKEHVRTLYDFGVTCSYDELLRFKKSVAFSASDNMIV